MAKQTLSSDIRRFAVAGAQARLAEISLEVEAIRRAFPELGQNGSSGARTRRSAVIGGDEPKTRATRTRRTMTAAQRKAVGERMTKYWAARRGGVQAAPTSTSSEGQRPARRRDGKPSRELPSAAPARSQPPRESGCRRRRRSGGRPNGRPPERMSGQERNRGGGTA